jgi:hypothetical protein
MIVCRLHPCVFIFFHNVAGMCRSAQQPDHIILFRNDIMRSVNADGKTEAGAVPTLPSLLRDGQ